jgi:hypothetical protein
MGWMCDRVVEAAPDPYPASHTHDGGYKNWTVWMNPSTEPKIKLFVLRGSRRSPVRR